MSFPVRLRGSLLAVALVAGCGSRGGSDCDLPGEAAWLAQFVEERPDWHPLERVLSYGQVAGIREGPELVTADAPASGPLIGPMVMVFPDRILLHDGDPENREAQEWSAAERPWYSSLPDANSEVIVAIDASAPWRLVDKVLQATLQSGYVRINLLVARSRGLPGNEPPPSPERDRFMEGDLGEISVAAGKALARSCPEVAPLVTPDKEPHEVIVPNLTRCTCGDDIAVIKGLVWAFRRREQAVGLVAVDLVGEEVTAAFGHARFEAADEATWSQVAPRLAAAAGSGPVAFGPDVVPPLPPPPPRAKRKN